ncbi:hypothetical protein [Bradyrhizobium yuanmingense]|uniref:hypothetical protein n=1 Tax=Bradyrhizobium yuanmingense TaxID=108015 RepID=UPI0023B8C479|nr:hypothetical protein [Bradyrhizobium yuanmingense]MDF0493711.1 hypothetical protein [Bradyrhizobium yuanmingense]
MAPAAPPSFAGPPRPGPVPRAGLAAQGVGGGPAVVNAARTAAINIGSVGGYRHAGEHGYGYGPRAASYAASYAAGAYAGYVYGGAHSNYYASGDCYRVYRRHRRYLVCD